MKLETLILRNLIQNEDFTRQVIPHLKSVYFDGPYRVLFKEIINFVNTYGKLPNSEALNIELQKNERIPNDQVAEVFSIAKDLSVVVEDTNKEWLLEHTEKWCQDRSIYLAIMESINIIDGNMRPFKRMPSLNYYQRL